MTRPLATLVASIVFVFALAPEAMARVVDTPELVLQSGHSEAVEQYPVSASRGVDFPLTLLE